MKYEVIEDCTRIACFTGHRPSSFSFGYNESGKEFNKIMGLLDDTILIAIENGYRYFISGAALGVDTWAAELVLERRKQFGLKLELAIPCLNQDKLWRDSYKERYYELLKEADRITYVTRQPYSRKFMVRRNKYMVDRSSLVIAVYNGIIGGTQNCYNYALLKKKKVLRMNPNDCSITWINSELSNKDD